MSTTTPPIIYTWTDEAPALATHSFLPIIRAFAGAASVPAARAVEDLKGQLEWLRRQVFGRAEWPVDRVARAVQDAVVVRVAWRQQLAHLAVDALQFDARGLGAKESVFLTYQNILQRTQPTFNLLQDYLDLRRY